MLFLVFLQNWRKTALPVVTSSARFSEIFTKEIISKVRILSSDEIVEALEIREVIAAAITRHNIEASTLLKIPVLVNLS